jgi:transposase
MSDLFGVKGCAWLAGQHLPAHEREMVDACLRHLDFLDSELKLLDRAVAQRVLGSEEMLRLLQLPGVSATTAATIMAAIGDVSRFPTPRHLVGYFGLNPRVRQSGSDACASRSYLQARAGRRSGRARRSGVGRGPQPGALRAFWERTAAKRGSKIATIAVARKLVVLAWHLLTKREDYAFQRPAALAEKLRTLELLAGAPPHRGHRAHSRVRVTPQQRELDKELARQAEVAYRRLVTDWQATGPKAGAGATPGRASSRPSVRQAARQTSKPQRSAL